MSSHPGWLWANDEWTEASVLIDGDQVEVEVGNTSVGSWPRAAVDFTQHSDGLYSVVIEGEHLSFKPHTHDPFAAAIGHTGHPPTPDAERATAVGNWWKTQSTKRKAILIAGALLVVNAVANTGDSDSPTLKSDTLELSPSPQTAGTTTTPVEPTSTTMSGSQETVTAMVLSVTDGDTIRVQMPDGTSEPVRLIGIDAPETGQRLAAESKGFLEGLVLGKEVRLVVDVSDRDIYDRLLRYVFVDDLNVNQALVLAGYAIAAEYPPDTAMTDLLADAQEEARAAGVGGWAATTTTTTTTPTTTSATTVVTSQPAADCHPSYQGACVPNNVSDVDCAGGSGNGPYYVKGPVYVVGPDVYQLDRDGDGVACE